MAVSQRYLTLMGPNWILHGYFSSLQRYFTLLRAHSDWFSPSIIATLPLSHAKRKKSDVPAHTMLRARSQEGILLQVSFLIGYGHASQIVRNLLQITSLPSENNDCILQSFKPLFLYFSAWNTVAKNFNLTAACQVNPSEQWEGRDPLPVSECFVLTLLQKPTYTSERKHSTAPNSV